MTLYYAVNYTANQTETVGNNFCEEELFNHVDDDDDIINIVVK